MSDKIQIHNCHTHIFTKKCVPKKYFFIPLFLVSLLKYSWIQYSIAWVLRWIGNVLRMYRLVGYADRLPHLAAFAKVLNKEKQEEIFLKHLELYYPNNSRFVVLPMDFSQMNYGPSPQTILEQHTELGILRDKLNKDIPGKIIPFTHFDPQAQEAVKLTKEWIITHHFKGVKIYPPMGYHPSNESTENHRQVNERLTKLYEFCDQHENGLPIMTHCSGAIVRAKKFESSQDKHIAAGYCDPDNYKPILEKYKNLRLCLGHFGGNTAWETFLQNPNKIKGEPDITQPEQRFLENSLEMLRSGKYRNLFVDISYVIFDQFEINSKLLKVLLADPLVRSQVLFGTDFYMVEMEEFLEKQLSISLRAIIGEKFFKEIAETNPKRYLYGEKKQ